MNDDRTSRPMMEEGESGWASAAPKPPVISFPAGGGAIRGIGEKFQVNAATGTVELGSVRVGETLQIDDRESVRVDGIEAFRKVLDAAQAGDNVGLLFRELDRSHIQRGAVLTGT